MITLTPKSRYENIRKAKDLEHITNIFFNQRRKMIKKPMKQLFKDFEGVAKQLNIDLSNLTTTTIKKPKIQETSTIKLLSCLIFQNNDKKFCNNNILK